MKRNVLILGSIMLMGGLISSCSSDDEVTCPEDFTGELTTEEQQLLGDWTLTSITSDTAIDLTDDGEDNPSTNFFAQYGDCQKDAVYSFAADRSYAFDQSQNVEDCDNKLTLEGTWQLASDQLSMVSGCSLQHNPIVIANDGSAFSFSGDFTVRDVDGSTQAAKITFTYSNL